METTHPYADITRPIIGAAMEVHRELGCGFLESVYEAALSIELELRKIPYQRQKNFDILYKGRPAKNFVCDLVVHDLVVVELKALKEITAIEEAQLLNYLKVTNFRVGLLLNFGAKSLEVKRRVI
ncbi:MAG: GxxExxY protein [Sedimentisphaerales bacterium]|nr:GxxExxY protein [Sedimentisphaerales bacterium]